MIKGQHGFWYYLFVLSLFFYHKKLFLIQSGILIKAAAWIMLRQLHFLLSSIKIYNSFTVNVLTTDIVMLLELLDELRLYRFKVI